MKGNFALVALAAGISQVAAFGFHNAPSFSCPDNQDNHCTPDMNGGFDWSDLPFGGFGSYKGFNYKGYECSQKFGKRDTITGRTFQSKCITGKATQDRDNSAKISCDKSKGVDKTSIKWFQVTPEFDCDLEFHYTMPDGSNCKHRNHCKSSGTTVHNTQCGGATDVTIVYPHQPEKGKDHCNYGIHHIGFDCEGPKPTTSKHHSYPVYTPTYSVSTPASTPAESTPVETPGYSVSTPVESTPAESTPVETPGYSVSTPVDLRLLNPLLLSLPLRRVPQFLLRLSRLLPNQPLPNLHPLSLLQLSLLLSVAARQPLCLPLLRHPATR
ncbi:hypothetical protein F5B22DRAFT_317727 [Xylaria bambusicola]|uniref:uncharacterized protein n=1 Tax=Xylaria bambusicola TaxID=326684 RepID=UPI0020084E16|nr:uncharacterized protein F5B22DRAFT_317727 [Xylaria bambusicola]KAI0509587.1 hypothetical protein F5B22DRAFT_317727 [Xylaria bambusicola]